MIQNTIWLLVTSELYVDVMTHYDCIIIHNESPHNVHASVTENFNQNNNVLMEIMSTFTHFSVCNNQCTN